MVAGGVAFRPARYHEISGEIQKIKCAAGIKSEMKWSKYRGGRRQAAYEGLVDLFYLLTKEKMAAFHCIIAEFGAFAHKSYEGGTPESSVSRMYFQLCLHRLCQFYGPSLAIEVFPDNGNDSRELPSFRGAICAQAYNRYSTRPNCLRSIQPQDSELHNALQMADVIVGAIAAKRNRRELVPHKADLAEYVLEKSGLASWEIDTPASARFFTVWNFKHRQ
jgi:hypothetical protein